MVVAAAKIALPCPRCSGVPLSARMTAQGVEIDACPSCGGIWLDRGEIFHFVANRRSFASLLERGLAQGRPGPLKSPKTGAPMTRIAIGRTEIDLCPGSEGIWFDKGELERLATAPEGLEDLWVNVV